jgi:hypothetical protein
MHTTVDTVSERHPYNRVNRSVKEQFSSLRTRLCRPRYVFDVIRSAFGTDSGASHSSHSALQGEGSRPENRTERKTPNGQRRRRRRRPLAGGDGTG